MTKKPKPEERKPSEASSTVEEILERGSKVDVRGLFAFDTSDNEDEILLKFNLWARWFFPQYFKAPDAPFHRDIDANNYRAYRGILRSFTDIVFRGGAKTTRTKLFIAYAIANDLDHTRKYLKVLSEDGSNSKQVVTDVYNMLISSRVHHYYPEIFEKTVEKREETMASFTTATGVKMRAGTVGTDQRGQIQEDARPDLIWFDDFETRKTLRSAVETKSIWDNMEEARTGLSKDGSAIYTCNYLSERGNVHRLVQKESEDNVVLVVPIRFNGKPMWDAYTVEEIAKIEQAADDFAGEYLCVKPDTLVLTKWGWKTIALLRVGDKVVTHLNREQKILRIMQSNANDLLDITVNGKVVTITKNHPVLVVRGSTKDWVPAGQLTVKDFVCVIPHGVKWSSYKEQCQNRSNNHKIGGRCLSEIEKIEPSPYKGVVHNIEVEEDNSYVANGLVVHNCEPSAGAGIFFDRASLDRQPKKTPLRTVADFRIFHAFDPSHRYGAGHDVAGGVGLDSSTSVFIDFSTLPNKVAATFESNVIKPDVFGYEIIRQADMFGRPILAPENNKFDMCIGVLRHQGYDNIYFTEQKETRVGMPPRVKTYGWNTNTMTKPKMLFDLKKAVEDGHLELSDPALIAELRSYSRDDLMDKEQDVRLTTRHFDLLMACAIAYQMRNHAVIKKEPGAGYQQPEYERTGLE